MSSRLAIRIVFHMCATIRRWTLHRSNRTGREILLLMSLTFFGIPVVILQAQQPASPPKDDSVVRINTELVQTDLTVFDKHGHFVDGLRPEDFAITLDGKPQNIQFFERVAA